MLARMVRAAVSAALGAACLTLAAATGAWGQTPIPSRQEVNPIQRSPAPAARPGEDLLTGVQATQCPLRNSTMSFTLKSVRFEDATGVSTEDLAPSYAGRLGQTLPVAAICDIRDKASEIYFRRGIFAKVEIPPQRIEDGALTLKVIEARIVSVRVVGDAGPSQPLIEAYLEELRGLTPFDLDVAQRYLLLASDVPGVRLSVSLRPAAEGAGAVDLEVSVSRDRFDGVVSAQNFGSEAVGRWGGLARVDFNSFTRFGERTSLVLYSTLGQDEQLVVQVNEELRLGSSGLSGLASLAAARSKPGGVFAPLNLESSSVIGTVGLSYPLIRHRRRGLDVSAGFEWIDQDTEFGGGLPLTEDRLRVLFGRVRGSVASRGWRMPTRLGGGLELRKGLDGLGASDAGSLMLSRLDGVPDAWVARFDGSAQVDFNRRFRGLVKLQGQYAEDPLLSYEELAVGNLTVGRGYDPAVNAGDRGAMASFELRGGPWSLPRSSSVEAFVFYDWARIENLDIGGDDRTLASAGFGLRTRINSGVFLDLVYAHPFDKPLATSPDKPEPRLLVGLSAILF
jgi:hemolysin activation/secretion protein